MHNSSKKILKFADDGHLIPGWCASPELAKQIGLYQAKKNVQFIR